MKQRFCVMTSALLALCLSVFIPVSQIIGTGNLRAGIAQASAMEETRTAEGITSTKPQPHDPFMKRAAANAQTAETPAPAQTPESSAPARGFPSEDACAKAVAEALVAGDAQAFLSCYAIAELARGFNLAAHIEAFRSIQFGNTLLQPDSDLNIAYNEANLTNALLKRLAGGCYLLKSAAGAEAMELFTSGVPLMSKDYPNDELLQMADMDDVLQKLSYQGTMLPDVANTTYLRAFMKYTTRNKTIYGMREWTETIALLDMDGRTVYLPLALVRYDAGWLAAPLMPVVATVYGMPSNALLAPEDDLSAK